MTKNYFDYDSFDFLNDYQLMINSFLDPVTHQEGGFSCTELYSPPNISGRILQQNSIFLCQIHHIEMRHRNEQDPRNILLTQKIKPDFVIEVANKRAILNELDMLGINLKTVFGDYDNIAKYIRNNFFNGMDEPI